MPKPPFITFVKLRNYKSIAKCDVALEPLGILVGPNGSGKSNFLDALHLASQSLLRPLPETLRERGGVREVLRRSGDRPDRFSITLRFDLPGNAGNGFYGFEIKPLADAGFEVTKEVCEVSHPNARDHRYRFEVSAGEIINTNLASALPRPLRDRLFLVSASNLEEFHPAYDALTAMRFYQFVPDKFRIPNLVEQDPYLHTPDGHNLASVLGLMEEKYPLVFERLQRYMQAITPGLDRVRGLNIPETNHDLLSFTHEFGDRKSPIRFTSINMSDGTLRALATLTALLQGSIDDAPPLTGGNFPPTLIGIEEPETALHPAAAGVLWDAITDGSDRAQILVTTQSPDLLDRDDIPIDAILAVDVNAGKTEIGPLIESSRNLLNEKLSTPGELMRQSRLSPLDQLMYPQCLI